MSSTAALLTSAQRGTERGWRRLGAQAVGVALLVLLALVVGDGSQYLTFNIEIIAIYVIAATGLNIAIGLTGQFQMAQAGFMGIAAYATAILVNQHHTPELLALLAGIGLAIVSGLIAAIITARTRSHYLLLATFSFQIIELDLIKNLSSLTGGVNGTSALAGLDIGPLHFVGSTTGYTVFVVIIGGIALVVMDWLKRSYVGLGMQGTRQNELATAAAGGSPRMYRAGGIIVSATFGGVAGVLFGPVQGYITPDSFGLSITLLFLIIVVLGGMGSVLGVGLAAIVLTYAQQEAQSATTAWPLYYGAFVMILLVFTPRGLSGMFDPVVRLARKRFGPVPVDPAMNGNGPAETVALPTGPPTATPERLAPRREPARLEHTGGAALELVDVKRRFGGVRALDGVSLTVEAGTVHGLVGPNGSGKTTLLNVVSAFTRPQEGRIVSFGADVTRKSSVQRARLGIGRSFQHPSVLMDSTVLENAQLGILSSLGWQRRLRSAKAMPSAEQAERIEDALALANLQDLRDVRAADLSYGHRRLLDIVRVIVSEPKLVVLDEPTSGVGAPGIEAVKDVILALRARGVSVLVVEHNMRFVVELCDWVTVLDYGRVISRGEPEDVIHDEAVIEAYLGLADA